MEIDRAALEKAPSAANLTAAPTAKTWEEWFFQLRKGADIDRLSLGLRVAREAVGPGPGRLSGAGIEAGMNEVLFVHGDLEVNGNLTCGLLVVTGNVAVSGLFAVGSRSMALVGGSLKARDLYTSGDLKVFGAVDVQGLVFGALNDGTFDCGKIRARVVVEDDHLIMPAGVEAAHHFEKDTLQYGLPDELKGMLRPELVDEEGIRRGELYKLLSEGTSPFRS